MRRVIRNTHGLTVMLAVLASVALTRTASAQEPVRPAGERSVDTVAAPSTTPAATTVQPAGPRLQPRWQSAPAPAFPAATDDAAPAAASTTIRMSTLTLVLVVVILVLLIA